MIRSTRWVFGVALLTLGVVWIHPLFAQQSNPKKHQVHPAKKKQASTDVTPKKSSQDDQECNTGCASHGRIKTPALSKWMQAVHKFAKEPLQSGSPGLETLLFHGHMSRKQLAQHHKLPLPPTHLAFLNKELQRTHAKISVRIVTDQGKQVVTVAPHKTQISHHFHLKANKAIDIQTPSFGGRIERVGLNHLWVRI